MQILILGGAGYIGRVIADQFLKNDHNVAIYDLFYFSDPSETRDIARTMIGDTRDLKVEAFEGYDMVIDLAAISNDPAGELDPELTRQVNAQTRIIAANLARCAGVKRYLLVSSCSVYGSCDTVVDEGSSLNPLTTYARSNILAETGVLALNDANFCATAFRLATVFGRSPSTRFDLVVNTMTLHAYHTGRLTIGGGGEQYRPLVFVGDVARAAACVAAAPSSAIGGQIFNISRINLRMCEVGEAVVRGLDRAVEVRLDTSTIDHRNYRVATTKARRVLDFVAETSVEEGAAGIMAGLESGAIKPDPLSIRLNGYRQLVSQTNCGSACVAANRKSLRSAN